MKKLLIASLFLMSGSAAAANFEIAQTVENGSINVTVSAVQTVAVKCSGSLTGSAENGVTSKKASFKVMPGQSQTKSFTIKGLDDYNFVMTCEK